MSRMQRIFWTLLAAFCTTLSATRMYAVTAHLDDLDSLVHLSTDVIEVEVTRSSRAEGIGMIEARVALVHKGGFKKGEIVAVTNIDSYRKAEKHVWQEERLATADRLVLFVVPLKPREPTEAEKARGRRPRRNEETADETARRLFGIPADVVIYATLPGGMRFIQGGHVFAFLQWSNSGYLTRIAKAALATRKHEELCGSLIHCLDFFCRGIVQNKPAPMMADLRGALAALKELYDTQPSQSLQFAIETATANVPDAYEKLKSPCERFISILSPVDPAEFAKPEKPSLIFGYEYLTDLSGRDAGLRLSVVLVHQGTKKRYVLSASLQIRGWSMDYRSPTWTGVRGANSVQLPKELAPGPYHVFLQLSDGDKVISTGHYFSADL